MLGIFKKTQCLLVVCEGFGRLPSLQRFPPQTGVGPPHVNHILDSVGDLEQPGADLPRFCTASLVGYGDAQPAQGHTDRGRVTLRFRQDQRLAQGILSQLGLPQPGIDGTLVNDELQEIH